MREKQSKQNIWRGILVGLVAGLAASWTMDRFQDIWIAVTPSNDPGEDANLSARNHPTEDEAGADDATVKAATALSEGLFEHKLTSGEKKIAGPVVHYFVGATSGIVYGLASEVLPEVTAGFGLPYGTVFWLVVDEGAVSLLRLSKPPTAYPLSTHIYALASHLVFGATAEGVRRLLRG
jgi:uncharacterized membrane protein YagU involved in acid resistance